MHTASSTILLICALSLAGNARGAEQLTLTARLLEAQQGGTARFAIDLRNVSGQLQRVVTLTNLFTGRVYLRTPNGVVREFTQTNYWNMKVSTLWATPTLELAPGALHRFEHAVSDFIDAGRMSGSGIGKEFTVSFPTLAAEFQRGCEVWCEFDAAVTLRSPAIQHPSSAAPASTNLQEVVTLCLPEFERVLYFFQTTRGAMLKAPPWEASREFPPLSPRAAEAAALRRAMQLRPEISKWHRENIILRQWEDDYWYYMVTFWPGDVAITGLPSYLEVPVLMNGQAVEAKNKPERK